MKNCTLVESLKVDVQALLQLGQKTIQQIGEKELLKNTDFDELFVCQAIDILRGEHIKLEELEMVLAVVGTMKAGKSTTINAIVGTEILPNRNVPMTAIPTLIKHTKGQMLPRFVFSEKASKPINQLIRDLNKAFKEQKYKYELEKLRADNNLYELVEIIQKGAPVVNEALGEHHIIKALHVINDLVRVAPKFDLEFPFGQYQEIDQFPVIEIEFSYLKEAEDRAGKLILLDTPGPNEAGQKYLRPMLQDQLKKASAVLVVMDYTQLKSEADAQVRDDLKAIGGKAKDRIYALVNKFDNCDRNGMQEKDVKEFVEGLTGGLIEKNNVYPVSTRFAYLANRARQDRKEDGSLPDLNAAAWVEDFYQEAGLRRDRDRTPEKIAEGIEDLWEDSKFSQPLKEVIEESHKKTALIALESALDKLADYIDQLTPAIFILEQKKTAENKASERIMLGLKNNLKEIEKLLKKIEVDKKNTIKKFSENVKKLIGNRYLDFNELLKASLWKIFYLSSVKEDKYDDFEEWYRNGVTGLGERPYIKFHERRCDSLKLIEEFLNTGYVLQDSMNKKIEKELCDFAGNLSWEFEYYSILENIDTLKEQVDGCLYFGVISVKLKKEKLFNFNYYKKKFSYSEEINILNKIRENSYCGIREQEESTGEQMSGLHINGSYIFDIYELKKEIDGFFFDLKEEVDQFVENNIAQPILEGMENYFDQWRDEINKLRKEADEQLSNYKKILDSSKKNELYEIQKAVKLISASSQLLKQRLVCVN